MKYEVTISERAEKNLDRIFVYLYNNWPEKVKNDFKNKLKAKSLIYEKTHLYTKHQI